MMRTAFNPRYEAKNPLSRIAHEKSRGKGIYGRRQPQREGENSIDNMLIRNFSR